MKIAVTGASGMLGTALLKRISHRFDVKALARSPGHAGSNIMWYRFDLTDSQYLQNWLVSHSPDVIVHCAANVDVEACEADIAKTTALHVDVTSIIANYCEQFFRKLI